MCEHVETEEEKGRKEGGELQREGSTERSKEELEGGGAECEKSAIAHCAQVPGLRGLHSDGFQLIRHFTKTPYLGTQLPCIC